MSTPPDLFFDQLRVALSSDRLEAYRRGPAETDLDLLARDVWNLALSEALYPTLHAVEIALRNNLHTAISQLYGTPDWLTRHPPILAVAEQDQVAAALSRVQRSGKPLVAGRIVAELNFGFWTSLLDRRYEQRFWPRLLRPVLPNLPRRRRTRHTVSARMSEVRRLRNRVFHYEPIWHWQDLAQQHQDLLEAINWLNAAAAASIALVDRFPAVYGQGSAPYWQQYDQLHRSWP